MLRERTQCNTEEHEQQTKDAATRLTKAVAQQVVTDRVGGQAHACSRHVQGGGTITALKLARSHRGIERLTVGDWRGEANVAAAQ